MRAEILQPLLLAASLLTGCVAPHYHQWQLLGVRRPEIHESKEVECHLSRKLDRPVTALAKVSGFATTPIKALGVFGWIDYGKWAVACGKVRAAEVSTDRLFTVDLELRGLQIADEQVVFRGERFIRAEIYLGWIELSRSERNIINTNARISGRLVWDGDGHIEIHPRSREDIRIVPAALCVRVKNASD